MHTDRISVKRSRTARLRRRWRWVAAAPVAACLAAAGAFAAATASAPASAVAASKVPGSKVPGSKSAAAPASKVAGQVNCAPPGVKQPPCYSPQAYEVAYGVAPLLSRGINGKGETVVMPELAETPDHPGTDDIRQDLAAFDSTFGMPAARLNVVNTIARSKTPYADSDEEIEDTEMVHAMAPGATLDVVLVPEDAVSSTANFAAAVAMVIREGATLHAAVISISASDGEHFFTRAEVAAVHAALVQARGAHVTVVVSSGDTGAISDDGPPRQVSLPASDPLALAVGGTILDATPVGAYLGEMAWNGGTDASAGGYSSLFPRPAYQDGLARARATRSVPDVAANAAFATAMAVAFSDGSLRAAGGTSASTPLWAGVIALADQQAGRHLGFVNTALYRIARGPAYHRAFHDVVTGDNSVLWPTGVFLGYTAGPGWDPVTGWGSPDAQFLVPLLARTTRSGDW